MFTPVGKFESINQVRDLPDGTYHETCLEYQNEDGSIKSIVRTFCHDGENQPSVCDLLVILQDDTVLFRDFMLLADKSWRDSYGHRSEHLAELFPDVMRSQRLLSTPKKASIVVNGGVFV